VIGFLVIGAAYIVGDADVGHEVKTLAEISRFVSAMQAA
jgi:hypothetical protein